MLLLDEGMDAVAQVDVFSFAAAAMALLLAVALLVAYAINRRLSTFIWWAGTFALLALWLATATLRVGGVPSVWFKWLSWGSFYAAACLVAFGLYRAGAIRNSPMLRVLVCGVGFVVMGIALTMLGARPHHWFLIGPVPTLVFMAWSAVLVFRAGTWGYGVALLAGIGIVTLHSLLHPAGLARVFSPPPPQPALRGGFGPANPPGEAIALDPNPVIRGLFDFAPPPGPHPPVEQPLTVTLLMVMALLALAIALVLRDVLTELDRMRERSSVDGMTGLLNRATFEEAAAALLRETGPRPISMILFDIDHFKRVNDTAGHAAGDLVIARLGQLLREMIVLRAIAGRVGGEEFAVILGGSDLEAARLFANAIRSGFSASDFGDDIGWGVTLSAGIARHLVGENLHALTARADKALYAAKTAGRDKVMIAPEAMDSRLLSNVAGNLAASA